jgi:hypothetical protein
MLRYYMGVADPDALDDHTWAQLFAHLIEIRKAEAPKR